MALTVQKNYPVMKNDINRCTWWKIYGGALQPGMMDLSNDFFAQWVIFFFSF